MPTDIGGRGFAGKSLCKAYNLLDITGACKRKAISRAPEAVEKVFKMAVDECFLDTGLTCWRGQL